MQEDHVRPHDSLYLGEGMPRLKEGNTNSLLLWYSRCVERQDQIPDRSRETEVAPALQKKGTQDKWKLGANIPFCSISAMLRSPWCLDTEVQKTRPLLDQLSWRPGRKMISSSPARQISLCKASSGKHNQCSSLLPPLLQCTNTDNAASEGV